MHVPNGGDIGLFAREKDGELETCGLQEFQMDSFGNTLRLSLYETKMSDE